MNEKQVMEPTGITPAAVHNATMLVVQMYGALLADQERSIGFLRSRLALFEGVQGELGLTRMMLEEERAAKVKAIADCEDMRGQIDRAMEREGELLREVEKLRVEIAVGGRG